MRRPHAEFPDTFAFSIRIQGAFRLGAISSGDAMFPQFRISPNNRWRSIPDRLFRATTAQFALNAIS